jgi:hypothetical protein
VFEITPFSFHLQTIQHKVRGEGLVAIGVTLIKFVDMVSFAVKFISLQLDKVLSEIYIITVGSVQSYFKMTMAFKISIGQIFRHSMNDGRDFLVFEMLQKIIGSFAKIIIAYRW